jgi:hypothetical protein
MIVTVTFDLHRDDEPSDIGRCVAWLGERDIRATFLLPTSLLGDPAFRTELRAVGNPAVEFGSHSHLHSREEMVALRNGDRGALAFLEESRDRFEAFFGCAPRSFRSPCWCPVGTAAYERLIELGYQVDCSSAPQRLAWLSSFPTQHPWVLAPRRPHFIRGSLLEIPTSCWLVPAASSSFLSLRRAGSRAFLRLFRVESALRGRSPFILNPMFHVGDCVPGGKREWKPPYRLAGLLPRREGGFEFRHWFRETDRRKAFEITAAVLQSLAGSQFLTLSEAHQWFVGAPRSTSAVGCE